MVANETRVAGGDMSTFAVEGLDATQTYCVAVAAVDAAAAPISTPTWRCASLEPFYKPQWRRLSTLLGWAECCTVEAHTIA